MGDHQDTSKGRGQPTGVLRKACQDDRRMLVKKLLEGFADFSAM
jgi:hypothetical protein